MTIKLYVNWNKKTILSEKQAREEITKHERYNLATSYDSFNDWLFYKSYDLAEVFNMSEEGKKIVRAQFMEEMKTDTLASLSDEGYEEISVEI